MARPVFFCFSGRVRFQSILLLQGAFFYRNFAGGARYESKTKGILRLLYRYPENLTKPDIKNYIAEKLQKADKSRIATAEEVLEYLTNVVRNEGEKTCDRTKAAELLGKRYAIFAEKIEADTTVRVIMDKRTEEYSG